MATLKLEIITPTAKIFEGDVDRVDLPGVEGDMGVLPGHALLISTVRPGVIDVYADKVVSERIFVSGGFAEVTPERCTVLADDPAAKSDLPAWCQLKSQEFLGMRGIGSGWSFLVRRSY